MMDNQSAKYIMNVPWAMRYSLHATYWVNKSADDEVVFQNANRVPQVVESQTIDGAMGNIYCDIIRQCIALLNRDKWLFSTGKTRAPVFFFEIRSKLQTQVFLM